MTELAAAGPPYAELHCHSFFSLLDGAASPEALVAQAQVLGLQALALTDHDSLAGAVRFHMAAREAGLHSIIGVELTLQAPDGELDTHLTLLAETQPGYANLCRLITQAHLSTPASTMGTENTGTWPGKTPPRVSWQALETHRAGLIALSGCRRGPIATALLKRQFSLAKAAAQRLLSLFGPGHLYIELQQHYLQDDDFLLRHLIALSRVLSVSCVATSNVHYATREQSRIGAEWVGVH